MQEVKTQFMPVLSLIQMRILLRYFLFGIFIIILSSVIVFSILEKVPFVDALFSVITMFIAGDAGSIHLDEMSSFTKFYIAFVMLAGAGAIAVLFGMVADYVLSARLEQFLGKKRKPMTNHVILCGIGHIGYRILEELEGFKAQVLALSSKEDEFVEKVRRKGVEVIIGNLRDRDTLVQANISEAKSIIIATDDDLTNLELALNAREMRSDIIVVLRMFDQQLARKVQGAFNIRASFSTTALAAPAFAAASYDKTIMNSFHAGSSLFVTVELEVAPQSKISKMSYAKLRQEFEFTILKYIPANGQEVLHPTDIPRFRAGDKLVVICTLGVLSQLKSYN